MPVSYTHLDVYKRQPPFFPLKTSQLVDAFNARKRAVTIEEDEVKARPAIHKHPYAHEPMDFNPDPGLLEHVQCGEGASG